MKQCYTKYKDINVELKIEEKLIMDNNFNHVSFLWNIAESLRGTYKEEDYRKVMLPMIVVRRFDCLLDNYNRETIKEVYNTYTRDVFYNFPESQGLCRRFSSYRHIQYPNKAEAYGACL